MWPWLLNLCDDDDSDDVNDDGNDDVNDDVNESIFYNVCTSGFFQFLPD